MKKHFILLAIVFATILAGCSSKGNITVTTNDVRYIVNVSGSNDFFEVLPGTYPVTEKDGVLSTTIEFVIKEKYRNPQYIVDEFSLMPTDKEEDRIEINGNYAIFSAENLQEAYRQLATASVGDQVEVSFKYVGADKKQTKEMLKSIVSCRIELEVDEPEEEDFAAALEREILEAEADLEEELNEDSDEYVDNSSSSEDWDAILDSYENYMNQYIKVLKKVNAGDASAYSEMLSLMEECNELNEKLSSASDNMSVAQMNRFQKIAAKFASAAATL